METIDRLTESSLALPERILTPYSGSRLRSLFMGFVVMGLAALASLWAAIYIYGPIVKGLGTLLQSAGHIPILALAFALLGNLYVLWCFGFIIWAAWSFSHAAMQRFGDEECLQGVHWKYCELYRKAMREEINHYACGRVLTPEKVAAIVESNKQRLLRQAAHDAIEWAANQTIPAVKEHRDEPNLFSRIKNSPRWAMVWIFALFGIAVIPLYIKYGMTFLALLPQESLVVLFGAFGMLCISYFDYLMSAREWVENLFGEQTDSNRQSSNMVIGLLALIAIFMIAGWYRAEPEKAYSSMPEVRDAYRNHLLHRCDSNERYSSTSLCRSLRQGHVSLFDGEDKLFMIEEDYFVDSRTFSPYREACIRPAQDWMIQEWPFLPQTCYRLAPNAYGSKIAEL